MLLSFFGDAIVAVLLVATISYAAVLNRRLGALRADRAKLDELIRGLTAASQRAESGIATLKSAAQDVGRQLERRIEQAQGLRDDLTYMVERGAGIADRLETTIRSRRDEPRSDARAEPRAERVERRPELWAESPAARPVEAARPAEAVRPAEPRATEARRAIELPRVLEMLRGHGRGGEAKPAAEEEGGRAGGPSRAERDLLRALGGRR